MSDPHGGRPLTSVPRPQITDVNIQRLQRFDRIEKLRQHFWQRFSNEHVSLIQQKTKWQTAGQELKTGTMVLVRNANLPPLLWLLGRVVAVETGSDGHSRVADILTKKGIITRAYNNICSLPVSSASS
uniref:SFRICE_033224 n=1 Tax=Spodoptera frugiperda TaxID=7108 RepID=A0A2H1WMB8_SPOFR